MTERSGISDAEIEAAAKAAYDIPRAGHPAWLIWEQLPSDSELSVRRQWIEIARAALEAAAKVRGDGWQPIETAPKDGSYILIWHVGIDAPVLASWRHVNGRPGDQGQERWRPYNSGMDDRERLAAQHWRPLLEPPSAHGEKDQAR